MSDVVEAALFNGDDQTTGWETLPHTFTGLDRNVTRVVFRRGDHEAHQNMRVDGGNGEARFELNGNTVRASVPGSGTFATIGLFAADPTFDTEDDGFDAEADADPNPDREWDLIGLVCDQIDRANPDLPIETCQAIAKDIIKLVRSHDG